MNHAMHRALRATWMRLLSGVLLALLALAAVHLAVAAHVVNAEWRRTHEAAEYSTGETAARIISERLAAADAVARAMTSSDAGADGSRLRQHAQDHYMFNGAVTLPWSDATAGMYIAPVMLEAGDRLSLRAGNTLLRTASVRGAQVCYLIRAVSMGATPAFAYLALDSHWLWSNLGDAGRLSLAVTSGGAVMYSSAALPAAQESALLLVASAAGSEHERARRSWQASGVEWRGSVGTVPMASSSFGNPSWAVVTFERADAAVAGLATLAAYLPITVGAALLLALAVLWYCRSHWWPPLRRLQQSIEALAEGRVERIYSPRGSDAPQELTVAFNRALDVMEARQRALQSLAEIDRLLLEARPLESALDRVLTHFCAITGCHGASLILPDDDAPGHGRAYAAVAEDVDLPVSRVSVDSLLLEDLRVARDGLTITRCEPQRHSLLDPLRGAGCEFFWLWPAISGGRVVAVLAAGYSAPPAIAGELALYGTECAARLGLTIDNQSRDEALYRQAHFDTLTGLPNRLLFRDRLSQELASVAQNSQRGALLYIDLDHFKKINDNFGHNVGDQLLQVVAQRLRTCVKDSDTVARLGGDEFSVILRQATTPESARAVADRVIRALHMPVNIGGRDQQVRVSIGITMYPDDASTIDDLIRNADLAMYQAKESGRAQVAYYDPKMQQMTAVIESGLFRALRRREFSLYFQPQYSLTENQLVGVEALLRWQPPRQSMRLPGDFIPAAEQSGLIVDIGAWVLESACSQYSMWRKQGIAPPRLALNVSVQQLRQPDFLALVERALEQSGLPPQVLEIEITESVFADDEARQCMQRLAALGVRLALDDFGTGYSSLGFLRQHPVQTIKIDRSFIEEVPNSITAATLAETMIVMAHALGKQVVAEGVETAEQLEFLRERHCDVAQGYYLSRPLTEADISALLISRRPPLEQDRRLSA